MARTIPLDDLTAEERIELMGRFWEHTEFMVLAAQYDQVHIIEWPSSWVIFPLLSHDAGRQVICVAASILCCLFQTSVAHDAWEEARPFGRTQDR
ncbi:MAG: hypothetical protein O3A59_00535 [Nitrospirae bacterium]|nr:hypothetical protein [Nitrospirota bacterium]